MSFHLALVTDGKIFCFFPPNFNLLRNSGFSADSHHSSKAVQMLVVGGLENRLSRMSVLMRLLSSLA